MLLTVNGSTPSKTEHALSTMLISGLPFCSQNSIILLKIIGVSNKSFASLLPVKKQIIHAFGIYFRPIFTYNYS